LDRFTGMTIFVKVVDAGSFAAAARHFGMSAAMASKHVQTLRFPGHPNTRPSGETTEGWDVHRYGSFACLKTVVSITARVDVIIEIAWTTLCTYVPA
jgi:hypothetical protein